MSIVSRFSGPPSHKQAILYQHATQVISLVERARAHLKEADQCPLDLNSSEDTTVVKRMVFPALYQPRGSENPYRFDAIQGELHEGAHPKMLAIVSDPAQSGGPEATLRYDETPKEKRYRMEFDPGSQKGFHPGDMAVRVNKATGALFVEQEHDLPWNIPTPKLKLEEKQTISPEGPTHIGSIDIFEEGNSVMLQVEGWMATLQRIDDTPEDLDPTPGVVVHLPARMTEAPGTKTLIPTPASMTHSPESGEVDQMAVGFGDNLLVHYVGKPSGEQLFSTATADGASKVRLSPEGQMTVEKFSFLNSNQVKKTRGKMKTTALERSR